MLTISSTPATQQCPLAPPLLHLPSPQSPHPFISTPLHLLTPSPPHPRKLLTCVHGFVNSKSDHCSRPQQPHSPTGSARQPRAASASPLAENFLQRFRHLLRTSIHVVRNTIKFNPLATQFQGEKSCSRVADQTVAAEWRHCRAKT